MELLEIKPIIEDIVEKKLAALIASDQKLSQLPDAPLPLSGADLAYVVSGGTSYKTTVQDIANLTPSGTGNLKVVGGWDASTNTPALASGVGTAWDAYVVTTGGNTDLNGIKTWFVGDVFWFNGETNSWQRIANTNYYYPFAVAGYFDGATGQAFDNGNQPVGTLTSGVGIPWHAYGVGNPGNYILDGNGDWEVGQTAMFNGITNSWFKFPALALNGRTGYFVTFPATQGYLFFGDNANWITQDQLYWDVNGKNFVGGFGNSIDTACQYSSILTGSGNTMIGGCINSSIQGNSNIMQDCENSAIDASGISQLTTASHFSKVTSSINANLYNSPFSSTKNTISATITNSQHCAIENAPGSINMNNCATSRFSEVDSSTTEQLTRTLVTSGDNGIVSVSDGSLLALNHKCNYSNINYSIVAGGDTTTVSGVTNGAILPGGSNNFSNINNCVMGGGFGNNISNVSNGVFLGMAAANIDCSGFNWNVVLCGTDTQNNGFKFTQINSDSIQNGSGNYCTYIGTSGIQNTGNLENVTCMGYNSGLFTPAYSDQLNLFYDNGLCIDRYGGRASITANNFNPNSVRTTFPLSVYICSPEDQIILAANTNGGASLTFVLPDESNFINGFYIYLRNISGNMGAAAVAQSGTGKLINGALTYNMNALNRAWEFIWMQSNNEWHAFAYQLT